MQGLRRRYPRNEGRLTGKRGRNEMSEQVEAATDYLALLESSYEVSLADECPPLNHLEYLSDHIFDFTTYDGGIAALFASKAVEVCKALSDGATFDYINDAENYRWYLLMVNMPFFAGRLNWGGSIRGAWWDFEQATFQSCGLYDDAGNQLAEPMEFTRDEWVRFIAAVIEFAAK
jgi:hypothetical protein